MGVDKDYLRARIFNLALKHGHASPNDMTTALSLDSTFEDLDLDSFDVVELGLDIEKEFGLPELPEFGFCKKHGDYRDTSVREVVEYISDVIDHARV